MKYSLCLETVFDGVDFYDRFQLAKDAGFDAVEFWEPEKFDAKKLAAASAKTGLPIVACCMFDTRTTTLNRSWDAIKPNLEKTIAYGKECGCNTFIGLTGNVEAKIDTQKIVILENLKRVAELCEKNDCRMVIEALNTMTDHLGYYLDSSYSGLELVRAINSPAVRFLYDMYHMQLMEGNLIGSITNNINEIAHLHAAGVPGRHELQNGEINYPYVIEKVEEAGYTGYCGFEYFPTYDSAKSLADIMKYLGK